jgi:flagellar biosynthesis protein FlhF
MNVKRFTARTSRDALNLVRQAFGADAVVLSTRPCADGIEVLAMAPEAVQQFERVATPAGAASPAPAAEASSVGQDVERLSMSTLSFQDYVRERMLRRRRAAIGAQAAPAAQAACASVSAPRAQAPQAAPVPAAPAAPVATSLPPPALPRAAAARIDLAAAPLLHDEPAAPPARATQPGTAVADSAPSPVSALREPAASAGQATQGALMDELRAMKGLIEERFGALAFMEKLQRQPRQAQLSGRLLEAGFSPALIRRLADSLPSDVEESAWAAGVLERNLATGEAEPALEDSGGVFALIGATGVGKTTGAAKLAAAFATRHGAANLGLITLDAYRIAAHEQLRAYGRILGVPVHTAHDRASLEDLLELLAAKKMVLIDTAGMAQRDTRTRELLEMLSHRAIRKLLVVNAAAQGETIEDQIVAYRGAQCRGVVLSKLDEAVKIGAALDALIRHKLEVVAVANGQRVPEDWHRLSAATLVQRALRSTAHAAWKLDAGDVNLVFAGASGPRAEPALRGGALPAAPV